MKIGVFIAGFFMVAAILLFLYLILHVLWIIEFSSEWDIEFKRIKSGLVDSSMPLGDYEFPLKIDSTYRDIITFGGITNTSIKYSIIEPPYISNFKFKPISSLPSTDLGIIYGLLAIFAGIFGFALGTFVFNPNGSNIFYHVPKKID